MCNMNNMYSKYSNSIILRMLLICQKCQNHLNSVIITFKCVCWTIKEWAIMVYVFFRKRKVIKKKNQQFKIKPNQKFGLILSMTLPSNEAFSNFKEVSFGNVYVLVPCVPSKSNFITFMVFLGFLGTLELFCFVLIWFDFLFTV